MRAEEKWFVFYTKSRQEKKVRDIFLKKGFDVFLPLQKQMRQWSDRKKKVEVPLFNSYIFIKTTEPQIGEVLQVPGIAWNVRHNGKPAILYNKEYEAIQYFLETGLSLELLTQPIVVEGDRVVIADGPLKGVFGQVAAKNPTKFTLILEGMGQAIRVEMNPGLLRVAK
jgi:transcription termination/antitermination protein NusG